MKYVAGLDEVGRGCVAGPVAVGLYVYPEQSRDKLWSLGAKDSKQLSEKKRAKLHNVLVAEASYQTVTFVDSKYIDRYGIDNCVTSALTHSLAMIPASIQIELSSIYLDKGLKGFWAAPWESAGTTVYEAPKDGESLYPEVAAASIIAKHVRDQHMINLHNMWHPQYDWANNKGYGTKAHYEAIDKYGLSHYHRRKFLRAYN